MIGVAKVRRPRRKDGMPIAVALEEIDLPPARRGFSSAC
jgi:hypothetical protein